jgi:glycolate oxidase subunit GlcD
VDQLIENLRAITGRDSVLADQSELLVYECDGLPQHKYLPRAVVFPGTTEETAEVMRVLARAGVAFTPRGAGTGLSGGALALEQGVVIELARMRKILRVDEANRFAVVQTGVVNSHVSRAVASLKLHYVPDPSSQPTCTIGGNIAENAGGVHCLKYGTTTDHVMGIRAVLAGGEIVDLGGIAEQPGYDLRGLFIGSEGTFGIATEATLRLVPLPPTVRTLLAEFKEVSAASHAVSAIIAAGVIPAGLEMMDGEIIRAVEASIFAAGLPTDAGAALLIELDGLAAGIDDEAERVKSICLHHGARNCRLARDENERKKLWAARKGAFGAIGRIAPDSMIQDAVVPRSRLPQIMDDAYQIAAKYRLRIANVFHAGDGNLHPLICFDSRSADEVTRVKEAGRELMATCVRAGGSITGEHGVGLDKRELLPLIFSDIDMETMLKVRAAFDKSGLMNPGKIIPVLKGCGEARSIAQTAEPTNKPPVATPTKLSEGVVASNGKGSFKEDLATALLSEVVGSNNVTSTSLPFSAPEVLTVAPGSIAEASEILKIAAKDGWAVVPAGKSSWLYAGEILQPINLIVSTRRLNKIVEHEPADLVAIAEAGIELDRLNQELGNKGQWLPLDPPNHGEGSVGAVIATGLRGPQSIGYGPPRGFVIGLKVVLADGRVVNAGGRVVKNVAGYDLCKLFTGSYGTLGLIVQANFKLRPRPESETSVLASGPIQGLFKAAQSILSEPLFPVALELVSPRKARSIGIDAENAVAVLLARFAGKAITVSEQGDSALSLLAAAGIANACTLTDDTALWKEVVQSSSSEENLVEWRASVAPSDLPGFIEQLTAGELAEVRWYGGIGDGRLHVSHEFDEKCVEFLGKLRTRCEQLGGSLIIENAPVKVKQAISTWGNLGKAGDLMRRIKQQLDPRDMLSPGRFAMGE